MLVLLVLMITDVLGGGGPVFTQGPDGSGKVGYSPPDLNDENTHSNFLPDRLRCEGCKAVAYQMFVHFRKNDRKRPSLQGRFPESLIYRITGEVCDEEKAFETYGLKIINDDQDLVGPGLDVPEDSSGVKQQGGPWPARLRDMCNEFIDKLGDMELYHRYLSNDLKSYTDYLCYQQSGVRGTCHGQKAYEIPDKLKNDDVNRIDHTSGGHIDEDDLHYYADDYEDDYDEGYYRQQDMDRETVDWDEEQMNRDVDD